MNKMRNAMYGMAVADAAGDELEFDCDIEFGAASKYVQTEQYLEYTDDTQMTLFTAQAIDQYLRKGGDFAKICEESYVDWYRAQTGVDCQTKLGKFEVLGHRKAPGDTCMDSLSMLAKTGTRPVNKSMGCGSVMRLLPFAAIPDVEMAVRMGIQSAHVTHDHEFNAPCVEQLIRIFHEIKNGKTIDHLVPPSVLNATCIQDLGLGWIAPECFKMGLYAALNARNFDELLDIAICHDGDSDSVAAIAGALWGIAGLEVKYTDKLTGRDVIEHVLQYEFMNK